jgi:hypothetical protein
MKFIKYYITNKEGKSNCVIRTFCKIFNEEYDNVYNELCRIQKELNCSNYNDIEVFEKYMENHNFNSIDYGKDIVIKELELDDDTYIVFCWNKDDFYHMLPIINNVIYDKEESSMNLFTLKLYKSQK